MREELAGGGAIFQTTIDSEVIAHVIAQERIAAGSVEQAVVRMMGRIRGAYSLLVMSRKSWLQPGIRSVSDRL